MLKKAAGGSEALFFPRLEEIVDNFSPCSVYKRRSPTISDGLQDSRFSSLLADVAGLVTYFCSRQGACAVGDLLQTSLDHSRCARFYVYLACV
jgi:hypothetical protein